MRHRQWALFRAADANGTAGKQAAAPPCGRLAAAPPCELRWSRRAAQRTWEGHEAPFGARARKAQKQARECESERRYVYGVKV